MNRVILMGRLTRDPDIRYTNSSPAMCIARYTLAVDRGKKNEDGQSEADFISCVAFGRVAELAEKYYRQGMKICLEGRIQTGRYVNRDGNKCYTTDVVVDRAEFAESKKSDGPIVPETPSSVGNGFMDIPDNVDDDSLPFN